MLEAFDHIFHAAHEDEAPDDLLEGVFVYLGVLFRNLRHEVDEVLLATLADDLRFAPESDLGFAEIHLGEHLLGRILAKPRSARMVAAVDHVSAAGSFVIPTCRRRTIALDR